MRSIKGGRRGVGTWDSGAEDAAGAGLLLVAGLAGLGLTWRLAALVLGWPAVVGEGMLAAAAFLLVLVLYRQGRGGVRGFRPWGLALLAPLPLDMMLMADGLAPYDTFSAAVLWHGGAVAQLTGAVLATRQGWAGHRRAGAERQASPVWLMPVVGCLAAPLAGTRLGGLDFSWFLFAVGISGWLMLAPLVLHRLLNSPLPPARAPDLFLLLAPPGVAALAFTALGHTVAEEPARLLVAGCFFTALVLLSLAPGFLSAPMTSRWAAAPFPVAMLAGVGLLFHDALHTRSSHLLAVALMLGASALTVVVAVRLGQHRPGAAQGWDDA